MSRRCKSNATAFHSLLGILEGASAGGGGFLPFLTIPDMQSTRSACHMLRLLVTAFPYDGKPMKVSNRLGSENSLAAFAASFTSSKVINLSGRKDITNDMLVVLTRQTYADVCLKGCWFITDFSRFAGAKMIDLSECEVDNANLSLFSGAQKVVLDDCKNVSVLPFENVQHLSLANCQWIDNAALMKVNGVRHLDISGNKTVTVHGIAHLVELEKLVLFGTNVHSLPHLPNLVELDCSFCDFENPEEAFKQIENVQTIRLKGCSDEMLEAASKCLKRVVAFMF